MGIVFFPTVERRGWNGLSSLLNCDSLETLGAGSFLGEIFLLGETFLGEASVVFVDLSECG